MAQAGQQQRRPDEALLASRRQYSFTGGYVKRRSLSVRPDRVAPGFSTVKSRKSDRRPRRHAAHVKAAMRPVPRRSPMSRPSLVPDSRSRVCEHARGRRVYPRERECQPGSGSAAPSDPNNRTPCTTNAECGGGQICTTIGCCPGCHSDADCAADSTVHRGLAELRCAQGEGRPEQAAATGWTPSRRSRPAAAQWRGVHRRMPTANPGQLCNVGKCATRAAANSCGTGQSCVAGRCYGSGRPPAARPGSVVCTATARAGPAGAA